MSRKVIRRKINARFSASPSRSRSESTAAGWSGMLTRLTKASDRLARSRARS